MRKILGLCIVLFFYMVTPSFADPHSIMETNIMKGTATSYKSAADSAETNKNTEKGFRDNCEYWCHQDKTLTSPYSNCTDEGHPNCSGVGSCCVCDWNAGIASENNADDFTTASEALVTQAVNDYGLGNCYFDNGNQDYIVGDYSAAYHHYADAAIAYANAGDKFTSAASGYHNAHMCYSYAENSYGDIGVRHDLY